MAELTGRVDSQAQGNLYGIKKTVTPTGDGGYEAPKTMISTVASARSVYATLRGQHQERIFLYQEIDGILHGNTPFDPEELRNAGLDHVANFNDMSPRATFDRQVLAYHNLLFSAQHLTKFSFFPALPESGTWGQYLAAAFDWSIKRNWPAFYTNMAFTQSQIVAFGFSPTIFQGDDDPRWRPVQVSKFFIPNQTQADIDYLTLACVETDYTIQYLWETYQKFKDEDKTACPWNVDEIGKLLCQLAQTNRTADTAPYEDMLAVERAYYSGDETLEALFSDSIRIVSFFQKEYDGKISHYMFHPLYPNVGFLFYKREDYTTLDQMLIIFTMSPGEYTVHSNLGLGQRAFSLWQAKMIQDNRTADLGAWLTTPLVKSPALTTKDIEQIKFYPGVMTNLGSAELVQNNMGANAQASIMLANYFGQSLQANLAYGGTDPSAPDPDKGSLSPIQTKLQALNEFAILKNNILHFYNTADRLYQGMVARMLKANPGSPFYQLTKDWKDRAIALGVPEEVFKLLKVGDDYKMPAILDVTATRVAGNGSQAAHLLALQELQVIAPAFTARAQAEYSRQLIMATIGPEFLPAFENDEMQTEAQAGGASLAAVENAVMQQGSAPVWSPDNDQRAHVVTHLALLQQVVQMLQAQQMDILVADKIFTVAIPHTGEHVAALARNPFAQAFFRKIEPVFKQLNQFAALVRGNAEKAAKARAEQQQEDAAATQAVLSEEQRKDIQAERDEQRKDAKLQAQADRQARAGEVKADIARQRMDAEIEIKHKEVDGKLSIEAAKASSRGSVVAEDTTASKQAVLPVDELGITPSPITRGY